MTSALVGSAKITITGDLSTFATSALNEIKTTMAKAGDVVDENAPALAEQFGKIGETGGAAFADAVKTASVEAAAGLMPTDSAGVTTAYEAMGAESGEAYSTGAATAMAEGGDKLAAAADTQATEIGATAKTKMATEGAEAGSAFSDGALDSLKTMAAAAAPMLGVLAGGELIKSALDEADTLEGAGIRVDNQFGSAADSVKQWAGTVTSSLRLSASAAETQAGAFGAYLGGLGVGKEQSAGLSETLVGLTANMAAFNNVSDDTMTSAIEAAMKGRVNTLKQYGVTLTTADINQAALAHSSEMGTIAMQNGQPVLNQQQKALATLYAVMADTKDQQNGLASTSDTLRAKQQVLGAEFDNFRATLGADLMPILAKVAGYLITDVVPALQSAGHWIEQNKEWIEPLAIALGIAYGAFKLVGLGTSLWNAASKEVTATMRLLGLSTAATTEETEALDGAMDANPIGLVVAAIAALAFGLIYAYNHSKDFRDIVQDIGRVFKDDVLPILEDVGKFFVDDFKLQLQVAIDAVKILIGLPKDIEVAWDYVTNWFIHLWEGSERIFSDAVNAVVGVIEHWYPLILGILSGGILLVPALIYKYWSQITGFISTVWDDVISFLETIYGKIVGVFAGAIDWLKQLGSDIITGLWNGIDDIWNRDVAFFTNMGSNIKGWFTDAIHWLENIGGDIMHGLFNGLNNIWQDEVRGWENIESTVMSWFGDAKNWLINAGEDIVNGLINGIKNVGSKIGSTLKGYLDDIPGVSTLKSLPGLSWLAEGGVVTKPTLAMIGEGGEPEIVLPLSKLVTAGRNGVASINDGAGMIHAALGGATVMDNTTVEKPIPASSSADVSQQLNSLITVMAAVANRPVILQANNRELARSAATGDLSLARTQ